MEYPIGEKLAGGGIFSAKAENVQEPFTVELKASYVIFDCPGNLINRHKKGQLTRLQRVKKLIIVVRHPKNRYAIGDKFHIGKMSFHVGISTQIVPRTPDPLDGHAVVKQAPYDPKSDKITKRIQTTNARTTTSRLNRWSDQIDAIPITKLMQ